MKINKISYALGSESVNIKSIAKKNYNKIIDTTGIPKIFKVSKNEDIITLALKAAKKVLVNEKKIDVIIFITQTPKYNIPPNSYLIHKELDIQKNCMVFDVNMGCSGYIYGLKLADNFLKNENTKNILLITSDNYSRYLKKLNVKLLFSDCATATLLTKSKEKTQFEFYSDGDQYKNLCQEYTNNEKNINENSLVMNGNDVFNFSITVVPKIIRTLLKKNNTNIKKIDYLLLHQASKIVNNNLQRKLNLNKNKFLENYKKFGNTVSSSIPLLIAKNIEKLKNKKIIMCGFGVGLSAGACIYEFK